VRVKTLILHSGPSFSCTTYHLFLITKGGKKEKEKEFAQLFLPKDGEQWLGYLPHNAT